METHRIQSQMQLDELLRMFDWSHGFIREIYALSPSYVDRRHLGTVAPDANSTMRLLFTFPSRDNPGLELIFEEVEQIVFRFRVDLNPVGEVNARDGSVELYLYGHEDSGIRAKVLRYVLLDESCWGQLVRYGQEDFCDERFKW